MDLPSRFEPFKMNSSHIEQPPIDSSVATKNGSVSNLKMTRSPSFGLVPTTSKHQVPVVFHEPHVENGFRALGHPWSYYIQSVFQLHNETVNIWTHILAFALMLRKMITFGNEIDFLHDPYTWPLLAGLICGMTLYACSSIAHCLQARSELAHYTAFMFDYAGIGLYGLGSVMMHLQYCSEDALFYSVESFFVPLGGVIAVSICFCCSLSKTIYTRPYPFVRKVWQMTPVAAIYVVLISPIVHRLYVCYVHGLGCNESIPYHIQQMILFALSGMFFAGEYPQRLVAPGKCDHFGHSHQLFHVAIMLCTLRQMDGVFIDFQSRHDILLSRPAPTFMSSFGTVLIVWCAELVCIALFYRFTKTEIIDKRKKAQ